MLAQSDRIRLYAWLGLLAISCVAADGGDDFSNNLFSDLSPLLALFGERVTMQFMSQSMGWADHIILAMAPLGIITIIVSAIRVGGPPLLKAVIGRAWENLSAAEAELMSSTSEEVCELWNGRGLVRCMGSAPIVEFISLLPKKDEPDAEAPLTGHWHSSTKLKFLRKLFECICRLQKEDEQDAKKAPMKPKSSSTKPGIVCLETTELGKVLHEIGKPCEGYCKTCKGRCKPCPECCKTYAEDQQKCTGCCKVCAGHCKTCKRYYNSCMEICKTCTRDCNSGANGQVWPDLESGNASSSAQSQQASSETDNNSLQKFSITRNSDHGSPNVSLNIHGPSRKFELVLVAFIGTILQIGVLVYGWFATYYPSLQFPKDDEPVASYAYPCTTTGTLLLVFGIAVCAHVVDSSTREREFVTKDEREIRVVWLQQQKIVSDQVFKSCAIYAEKPQISIKSSRRYKRPEHQDQTRTQVLSTQGNELDKSQLEKPQLGLEIRTIVGTAVTFCGFVLQFVGLRGMHWSMSVAQLIAVSIMVVCKAWVRRRLASPPKIQELEPGFEIDWLAKTVGNDKYTSYEHWGGQSGRHDSLHDWYILSDEETKPEDVEKRFDDPSLTTEDPSAPRSTGDGSSGSEGTLRAVTALSPSVLSAGGAVDANSQQIQSCAQSILFARKELGSLANWRGSAYDEAVCLSRAIEITMDTLFTSPPGTEWEWQITVYCDGSMQNAGLKLCREGDAWKVQDNEIDAALSLWLSSRNTESGSTLGPAGFYPKDKRQDFSDTASQSPKSEERDRLQLNIPSVIRGKRSLGKFTPQLERDLSWWVPRDLLRTSKINEDGSDSPEIDSPEVSKPSPRDETQANSSPDTRASPPHGEDNIGEASNTSSEDQTKLLAIDFNGSQKLLYAQSLFSLFMRAVAEKLDNPVEGGIDELLSDSAIGADAWKKLQLRNNTLSRMVQGVHQTGLGNLTEIYASIVTPLSRKGKLPQIDKVVEWVRDHAEQASRLEDWQRTGNSLKWLQDVATETLSTAYKADGILLDHLRRAISLINFENEQHFEERELPAPQVDSMSAVRSPTHLKRRLQGVLETIRSRRQKLPEPDSADLKGLADLTTLFDFNNRGASRPRRTRILPEELTRDFTPSDTSLAEFPKAFNVTEWHYSEWASGLNRNLPPYEDTKDILDRTPAHYAAAMSYSSIKELKNYRADLNAQDLLGWTPLHYACLAEHVDQIENLIQAGVGLDHQARDGATPLHFAISTGHSYIVRQLVGAGATVDILDFQGNLPMHLAAYRGHAEIVDILLNSGSRNLRDRFGRTALHQAALAGKKKIVDTLLANDVFAKDLEVSDRIGQTPLSLAARMGHLDCFKALLDKGADVDEPDRERRTPLYWVASEGHADLIIPLVHKGADMDPDFFGDKIPLRAAAFSGHARCIRVLLNKGANVHSSNSRGETALFIAAMSGHVDCVRKLLERGAKVESANSYDGTPLHGACRWGKYDVVEVLLEMLLKKHPDLVNLPSGDDKRTPLMVAAEYGQTDILELLFEKGANLELVSDDGKTALHYASTKDLPEPIETLNELGANKEAIWVQKGMTPLMVAAAWGKPRAIEQLLASGADVEGTNQEGTTALMCAAKDDQKDAIKQLLARKADIEHTDNDGRTALMYAAEKGNINAIEELLASGADIEHANTDGITALMCAAKCDQNDAIKQLLARKADIERIDNDGRTALMYAAGEGRIDNIQHLLDVGADIEHTDADGRTALIHAVEGGRMDAMKHLLNGGANIEHTEAKGMTALMCAIKEERIYAIEELIARGANIRHTDADGRTALMYAANGGSTIMFAAHRGFFDTVKQLLAKGADVGSSDKSGKTPLMFAAGNGNMHAVEQLLASGADVGHADTDGRTALDFARKKEIRDLLQSVSQSSVAH